MELLVGAAILALGYGLFTLVMAFPLYCLLGVFVLCVLI